MVFGLSVLYHENTQLIICKKKKTMNILEANALSFNKNLKGETTMWFVHKADMSLTTYFSYAHFSYRKCSRNMIIFGNLSYF